jgi:hypothetical protein
MTVKIPSQEGCRKAVGWVRSTHLTILPIPLPTMTIDNQIQSLINGAPDPESRSSVMAIAPILQQFAAKLPQAEYYISQSPQGEWVVTTLQHRQQNVEISVIYAFNNIRDLQKFEAGGLTLGKAVKMPIVRLLFDLLAYPDLDRIIFLTDSNDLDRGCEILRQDLESAIVAAIQNAANRSTLPPDVC